MNDPTAQMGFQVGKTALDAGQQYMEQNVCGIVPPRYFAQDVCSHLSTNSLTAT